MMKKQNRLRIACFLLFYFLMAFSSFGQRSDVLVRIESIQPKHLTLLQHYPIKICFRTDSYFLGTVSRDVLSDMGRLRLSYEVIDDKPWTEPYYLITRSEKLLTQELITPGELIYQSATEAIIKVKDQKAFELAKRGVRLTRIFNQSLPLFIEETQPLVLPQVNLKQNDLIRDLVAQISDSTYHSFLQRLQDFQTRYSFSDSNVSARNWLREKFLEFGYTEVQFDPFSLSGTIQQNVVSTRPGIQGTNRVIIVGGHYDSIVFDGTNPMVFAPGVDDNGSGTAGTLEIARVLANTDLETTVMFIPFAAEEQGLWGSNHFAQSAFENGMNIDIVLNMDMIANVSDNVPDFNILTNNQSMGFAHLVFQMTEEFTNFIPQIGSSGGGSDHLPFQLYGYPALFLHEGDFSPNWHRATDVIANVDISYATEVLKSVVATVVTVANSPAVPSGLTAIEVGDGQSQILTWDPNQEADLAGYKIYLGPSSGSYTTVMTVTSSFDTLHNLMENEPVYAAVSAFDVDQNESLLSQEIMFSPRREPVTPIGLEATSMQTSVELTWEANNNELDFVGYIITRFGPGSNEQSFTVDAPKISFIDNTAQPHILYRYTIQARDNEGNKSAPSIVVRGQLATHDRGILIVDGTTDGLNQPLLPSDEEVDGFYENILQNFIVSGEWDLADSAHQQIEISDADMAIYSTLIWHSDVVAGQREIATDTVALKKYLQNGGRLLMVGWSLIDNISSQTEPVKTFQPGDFVYDYLKVETARTGTGTDQDFIGADAVIADYPSITVDQSKVPLFGGNLFAMEVFESLAGGEETEVLYTYRSSLEPPSENHGQPVALRHLSDALKVIVIDFPLYFISETDAAQVITQALIDLGETVTSVDERLSWLTSTSRVFSLSQNYPNPFNPTTNIQFSIPKSSSVTLKVFDILGREVATLVEKELKPGQYKVIFNAKDLSSGVYFYRIQAEGFVQTKKLLLLK